MSENFCLSDCFREERIKIDTQISDEKSIAHAHTTINRIETHTKKAVELLKDYIKSNLRECKKRDCGECFAGNLILDAIDKIFGKELTE
jgi:hypothetical protein